MRKLFYLSFVFISLGCSLNRKAVVNGLISEINTPLNGKTSDTLKLIDCSCYLEENFFQFYQNAESYSKKNNIDGNFYWDKKFRWSLTEEDIKYMDRNLKKLSRKVFKKTNFKIKNTTLINNLKKISDEDNVKAIETGNYTYCLSNIIYNKNKDIAIISYKVIIPNLIQLKENNKIIFKKIKNNWVKICVIKSSWE